MKHLKRLAALVLALLCCIPATGCQDPVGNTSNTTAGSTDTATPTESGTEPETPPETEPDTPTVTEPVTEPETTPETEPETSEIEVEIYENGYTNRLVVGFDEYGRTIPAVSAEKEGREVGIFYFLWLGQHMSHDTPIYDIRNLRAELGDDVFFHQNLPTSPESAFHWWSEPLYGYYNSLDEWVIRRHMEMLTEAGIDFLCFDTTNSPIYEEVATMVMKVISELRAEGWDAPQVTWMTHTCSISTTRKIYNAFYKTNLYPDAWYCVDGKPMIITYTTEADDRAATPDYTWYYPGDLEEEIVDFFYIRKPRWPYDAISSDAWPYTEWSYPQPINGDMVSVSVASHVAAPFSFSISRENYGPNWGRGWDTKNKVNVAEDVMRGTFFDAQWKTVARRGDDARFVMITGWNEWVAQKNPYDGEYAFVDNVDMEYSRDIEPMKGGYEDAYYIQMMTRIREHKYESMEGKIAKAVKKTIDVTAAATQWEDVNAIYRRVGRDDGSRDANAAGGSLRYTHAAARNSLTEIRVTADEQNIYFYIKSESDIVRADEPNWMNIFIGTGTPEMKGWESYEYVINRERTNGTAKIEKLNADYTGTAVDATATYTVQGNVMQVSIPRAALGLTDGGDFYFKVADGVTDTDEIMDYYSTGRSMPLGRLSYLYQLR